MGKDTPPAADPSGSDSSGGGSSPLSLSRLREAFAAMLAPQRSEQGAGSREPGKASTPSSRSPAATADPCEINPQSVVEAMLFVGRPDGGSLSARELAAAMRGCSPAEVDAAIAELNRTYAKDRAPYEIVGSSNGYHLVLREEFGRMRDKFYGRVREARLSPAALEVLSIVAYNQPTTAEEVTRLRGAPSGAVLTTLVRRRLVRLDRAEDGREPPRFSTTDRFLRLLGLESLSALPRSEELEKA